MLPFRSRIQSWLTLATACACFAVTPAHAVTISSSAAAPTIDGSDIANLGQATSFEDFQSSFEWGDRPSRGQTFTTGSNASGYTLNAVTVQANPGDGNSTTVGTASYNFRVGTVTGNAFATVATETGSFGAIAQDDFVTFALDTPLVLLPNTVYGFDIGLFNPSPNNYRTVGWELRNNTGGYADGQRYSTGANGTGGATVNFHNPADSDRVFHLDLDSVFETPGIPEPATATLGLMGVIGVLMRRRKSA